MNLKKSEISLQMGYNLSWREKERECMDEHDNFFFNFYFYPPGLKLSINYKESSDLKVKSALPAWAHDPREIKWFDLDI